MNNYLISTKEHNEGKLKYLDDIHKYQGWNAFCHVRNISLIWSDLNKDAKTMECHNFYDYFFRAKGRMSYISAEVALLPRNRNGNLNSDQYTEDHPKSARFLLYTLNEWDDAKFLLESFDMFYKNVFTPGTNTLGISSKENQNVKYKTDKNGSMKVVKNIYERYEHIKFLPYHNNGGDVYPINGYPYEVPEWYIGYEEFLKGGSLSNFL